MGAANVNKLKNIGCFEYRQNNVQKKGTTMSRLHKDEKYVAGY